MAMTIGPLVTTDWLAAHLDDPNLRIVDIRGHVLPASAPLPHYYNHEADYQASHIPGASFVETASIMVMSTPSYSPS